MLLPVTLKSYKNNYFYRNSISLNTDASCQNITYFYSPKTYSYGSVISFKAAILPRMHLFKYVAMNEQNPKWANAIFRESELYSDKDDVRTIFERDKKRIVYSDGYDRLRYKTQVFPLPSNDMLSTRSSHVLQVSEAARNISKRLGLNEDLVEAIANAHDLGHAPFGHDGERSLKKISKENGLPDFWHEKNSLRMVDNLITLEDSKGQSQNLNLTYAVRDGIINHCGEIDNNFLKPREEFIPLEEIQKKAQVEPYTWEGVVVKISDKIAYLGRDIDDALKLGIYTEKNLQDLQNIVKRIKPDFDSSINNAALINLFVNDIVANSSPVRGIGFSEQVVKIMDAIKDYNMKNLYLKENGKNITQAQSDNVIATIFNHYLSMYKGKSTIDNLINSKDSYEQSFCKWLVKYTENPYRLKNMKNKIVYNLDNEQDYKQAIVDYISGMTDKFAMNTYNSIAKIQTTFV